MSEHDKEGFSPPSPPLLAQLNPSTSRFEQREVFEPSAHHNHPVTHNEWRRAFCAQHDPSDPSTSTSRFKQREVLAHTTAAISLKTGDGGRAYKVCSSYFFFLSMTNTLLPLPSKRANVLVFEGGMSFAATTTATGGIGTSISLKTSDRGRAYKVRSSNFFISFTD